MRFHMNHYWKFDRNDFENPRLILILSNGLAGELQPILMVSIVFSIVGSMESSDCVSLFKDLSGIKYFIKNKKTFLRHEYS